MGPYNNYFYNYYKNGRNPYKQVALEAHNVNETAGQCKDSKEDKVESRQKNSSRYNSFGPISFTNPLFADMDEPIIEILGIKLYLDDIIILGLLFFLYNENVKDDMLFLALIFLLIS